MVTGVKLSQIASGGAFVSATDNVVTVRNGNTDVLTTLTNPLANVTSVSNSDGTIDVSPTTGNVVVSRAGIFGAIAISAGSNIAVLGSFTSSSLNASLTDKTGTGLTVFQTSPTLITPTIAKLANLTTNGFVKTSGGDGTLGVDTTTYVSSVSGTANRITSTGGATPVIDIAATYVGQTSLTTLGTITTGVWNGTAIANANLANSSLTIGSTNIALGATSTTLAGLTSVTSTSFVGALTGNASTVTTNANLTGPITSVGNATSIASQTGTGTKFVVDTSPTLVTPVLGAATYTTLSGGSITDSGLTTGRVVYAGTGGLLTTSAGLTFAGTNLGINGGVLICATTSTPSTFGSQTVALVDTSGSVGPLAAYLSTQTTADASINNRLFNIILRPTVDAGITNSGQQVAVWFEAMRNYNNLADGGGTLTNMTGLNMTFGHFNTNAVTPTTTTANAFAINLNYITGTIGTFRGLYVHEASTGGTATTMRGFEADLAAASGHHNLYIGGTAQNYIAGKTGIGNATPVGNLEVSAAADPTVRLSEASSTTSYLDIIDLAGTQSAIRKTSNSGGSRIDMDALVTDGLSTAQIIFHRSTNTSGRASVDIALGTNSATFNHSFAGTGDSYVAANNGKFGVGTATPLNTCEVTSATGGVATLRRVDTSVTANDSIGILQWYAADTSTTTTFVNAQIEVQATNTISTDINPSRMIFRTTPTGVAAVVTEAFRLENDQTAQFAKTISNYNSIATVSNGVPSELATIDLTGQTANKGATTLYAVPASGAGMYRVNAYIVETTAGSISSTLPNVQIVYTDNETGGTITIDATPILGIAGIGQTGALTANTIGTASCGVIAINVKASTTIQYQTVNYASNLAGMAYALHIKLEAL